MAPPVFQLQASANPMQLQDPSDWVKDMEDGKAMYYKTKAEAEKRMGDLKELGKYKQYRVVKFNNSKGAYWRVEMSNGSSKTEENGEWKRDEEGGKAMYYKTKAEAEKRMGDLKETGEYSAYRVAPVTNSQGKFWRVEMRNGGGPVVGADWTADLEDGKAMYYKTKAEAEKRMGDLKLVTSYGSYRVVRFTNSLGKFWRVEFKNGGGDSPKKDEPKKEEVKKEEPKKEEVKKEEPKKEEVKKEEPKKKDEGPTTTTTKVTAGKAAHNLGLSDGVGDGLANKEEDVKKVREKLVAYGFLASDKKDQASLETAIGKFQKEVLGMKTPDKKISAGGGTDRALTTYYTAEVSDYSAIKTAQKDITVKIVAAPSSFATAMAGKTFNASTTVDNVDIKAMIALQDRLVQIRSKLMGSKFDNAKLKALKDKAKAKLTADEKKLVKSHIDLTIKGIKAFQKWKKADWWAKKKHNDRKSEYVLTKSKTKPAYKYGQVAPNDATFILLRDMEKRTISWQEDGKTKSRTRSNFVKSGHTSYTEGISDSGLQDPEKSSLEKYKQAGGLDESRAKALRHSSQHEGNYDGINTFDRAVVSYGFIQFAGGGRSLEYLFARIKANHPDVWQENFAKYGIDVEYKTNKSGVVDKRSCRVVVHDPDDKKTYRGMDAEHAIKNSPELIGVLMRAANNTHVQDEQIAVASDKYVKASEGVKMKNYKMKVLLVKDAKGAKETVKVDIEKYVKNKKTKKWYWSSTKKEIAAYKKTAEYKAAAKAKRVTEADLSAEFKKLTLGSIMKSEKERGALYGTYLNNPGASADAFRDAIVAIIQEEGLTSISQIKAISPDKLLRKAESKSRLSNHKERIKTARTGKDLKG